MFARLKEYVIEEANAGYFNGQINRTVAYDPAIKARLEELIAQHVPEKLFYSNSL
jgi:hypothetical protein